MRAERKVTAEDAIRESLSIGLEPVRVFANRLYPKETIRSVSRQTRGILRNRIRKSVVK